MSNITNFDYIYKIIMIGDSGVGKSNIVDQFVNGNFVEGRRSTIGVDFHIKHIWIGGDDIRLQIWDTAGQERFRALTRAYYQMAAGVVIVFDLTRKVTFDNIYGWLSEIEQHIDDMSRLEIMLVGNKSDLDAHRQVSKSDIIKLQNRYDLCYIETSAKTDTNVLETFKELITKVHRHKNYIQCNKYVEEDVDDVVKLIEDNNKTKSSCGCIIL